MTCSHGCCPSNRDHWLSVGVAASALPTRGGARIAELNSRERRQATDDDAYRRLRADGLQPMQRTGARELEMRAECPEHVETTTMTRDEHGGVVGGVMLGVKPRSFEVFKEEFGISSTEPVTTPTERT